MLPELVAGERAPKDKLEHAEVGYQSPSKHEGEHCSLCEHFIPSMIPRCMSVKNPIRAGDYCGRFERK